MNVPAKDEINLLPPYPGLTLDQITTVHDAASAQAALDVLLREPIIGFDTESRPTFRKDEVSDGPHVLQFATPTRAYLFQSHCTASHFAIAALLGSALPLKVGFGLSNDKGPIERKFGLQPQGLVELGRAFRERGYRQEVGARSAVAILFAHRFVKSKKVSTSNWSARELGPAQRLYAANDAWIALRIHQALHAAS
ncbi:3'-5' exonuclease [Andreprevotia lacus DSM 23236]|jgi:ribonuclease D|uniref:3'-5' exonuclease n=1 Tax=Andreprevotia lacus DSM 23236 TaxID=1121001 RepID=A0A1W1XHV4_9NEIS|nr:3'-5' exonuclease [Andreprevotia lacus]SMC23081.1 3'-5' exonuclease [Andreprevotia lacus DSM 23236]